MSTKTNAEVLIGGKIYTLSGYESESYLQKVANYINNKINEFNEMEQFRRFPVDMKATLVELNIADDYFKAKEQAERLEQDLKERDKEIYELKHDLISAQIKEESSDKATTDLERENRELLLNKARLEAALEDALLGKVKGQAATPDHGPSGMDKFKEAQAARDAKQKAGSGAQTAGDAKQEASSGTPAAKDAQPQNGASPDHEG